MIQCKKVLHVSVISGLIMAFILIISSIIPIQVGLSQPANISLSSINKTSPNISVQSTGLSKFQPAPTLPSSIGGAPITSKIMPEPSEPKIGNFAKNIPNVSSSIHTLSPMASFASNILPGQIDAKSLLSTLNATTNSNQSMNSSNMSITAPIRTFSLFTEKPKIITTGPYYAGITQREGRAFPPDVVIAVGSNYVLQAANNAGLVQTTDGGNVTKFRLEPFFNSGSNNIFDPVVVYDNSTKRFFMSIVDSTDGSVHVAISPSNSVFPLNQWKTFEFKFSGISSDCPDQAFIAVSSDKLAVGANVFSNSCNGGDFLGTQHIIVNKADLLNPNGPADPPLYISQRDNTGFSERPAKGATNTPDIYLAGVYNGDNVNSARVIKYTGIVPNVHSQVINVPLNLPIQFPPEAHQPGSSKLIETTGRVQAVSISDKDGNLWLTSMEKCKPNGDTDFRSCIRIIKIDPNSGAGLNIVLRTKGVDYLYPALSLVSDGHAIVTFGATSATLNLYPSLFAVGITPSGIIGDPVKIKQGIIPAENCYSDDQGNERCRYGDYFGASIDIDPLQQNIAWITGQYMATKDSWATIMAKIGVQ
jgi:hypothetical protein